MKRVLMLFTLLLFAITAVFCQDPIKDALEALGVSPSMALIASLVFGTVILQVVPQKWAGPTRWAKKIAYFLYVFLDKIDQKLNVVSIVQKQERLKKKELKSKLQVEQSRIMKEMGFKKPILSAILLLFAMTFINAQSPWKGFLDPVGQAVNQSILLQAEEDALSIDKGVVKIRTAFFLTAVAIDISQKTPVTTSLSAAGVGLSYGNWVEDAENKPYCKYSINAAFLTKMEFGESTDAKIGFSVTGDVFNKVFGFGPGVYFDAGKPKVLLLFNVSVPL
jgi:hypothetical protein